MIIFYILASMAGRIKKLDLTPKALQTLELGYRNGESHCFRMRCMAVLLKAKGLSAATASSLTDITLASVNHWVKRYQAIYLPCLLQRNG